MEMRTGADFKGSESEVEIEATCRAHQCRSR